MRLAIEWDAGIAAGMFVAAFGNFPEVLPPVTVNGEATTVIGGNRQQLVLLLPEGLKAGEATIAVGEARGRFQVGASGPGLFVNDLRNPAQPGAVLNQDSRLNGEGARARRARCCKCLGRERRRDMERMCGWGQWPATVLYSGMTPGIAGVMADECESAGGGWCGGQMPLYVAAGSGGERRVSNAVTVWVE